MRDTTYSRLLVAVGIVANIVPFVLFERSMPDLSELPFDNIWIAQYTEAMVNGAPLSVAPDPWFRYVPQVVLLEVVSKVSRIDTHDALVASGYYTLFCEAVAIPLALYGIVRVVSGRREAVTTLFVTALFSLSALTVAPYLASETRGLLWYYTEHWQYAWALPWVLSSMLAVVYAERVGERRLGSVWGHVVTMRYAALVTAGLCLGVAGSIQFIEGGVAAYVIAAVFLRRRELPELATVASVSMFVALPNVWIYMRYPGRWFEQGVEKSAPGEAQLSVLALALIAAAFLAFLVVIYVAQDPLERIPSAGTDYRVLELWCLLAGVVYVTLWAVGAKWYTHLTRYVFVIAALGVVSAYATRALSRRRSVDTSTDSPQKIT